MNTKKLVYVEMTPSPGKIFFNGKEYTDYICMLESILDQNEWSEVDIPADFGKEDPENID